MVGKAGQLLERSIVDRVVGSPERLVFEGPPTLEPPLAQDGEARLPDAREGTVLDSAAACPPLTIADQARLRELRAKEEARLAPNSAKARRAFIDRRARQHAERTGTTYSAAAAVIARQCDGSLLPTIELGEDITETLEVIPRRWKVIQHVREKFTCRDCEKAVRGHSQPRADHRGGVLGTRSPAILRPGRCRRQCPAQGARPNRERALAAGAGSGPAHR